MFRPVYIAFPGGISFHANTNKENIVVWFIISLTLGLVGLLWLVFAPSVWHDSEEDKNWRMKRFAWVLLIPAIIALFLSSFARVGAHNVGVEKSFGGATTGNNFGAGFHFKAPWNSVTDIDATIQPEEYKGSDCIYVKIADAGSACISVAYRWRINPDGADKVYADYRNSESGITEGVRKALVSTNIKAAINEVFGAYDPLAGVEITEDMTPEQLASIKIQLPDLKQYNAAIKTNVEEKIKDLGDLIEIQSVTVSYIKLPDKTQDRINQVNAKVVDVKLALQDVAIKTAQAAANVELAESLKDPNVLVSKCLDGMISGEIKAPAGFQCWSGNGGTVVVPAS
jgi:regulator of protease activity HflC (stomatin/prohibitin superfamily)